MCSIITTAGVSPSVHHWHFLGNRCAAILAGHGKGFGLCAVRDWLVLRARNLAVSCETLK